MAEPVFKLAHLQFKTDVPLPNTVVQSYILYYIQIDIELMKIVKTDCCSWLLRVRFPDGGRNFPVCFEIDYFHHYLFLVISLHPYSLCFDFV